MVRIHVLVKLDITNAFSSFFRIVLWFIRDEQCSWWLSYLQHWSTRNILL